MLDTIVNKTLVPFDDTPTVFDKRLFEQVKSGTAVLKLDRFFVSDTDTKDLLVQYADGVQSLFFTDFQASFLKMTQLGVKQNLTLLALP